MNHFFVDPAQVKDGQIRIEGGDVNHIKNVLRMKPGEYMEVSDGSGKRYLCRLKEIQPDFVLAGVEDIWADDVELDGRIYLFQGLPKSDKMELIIQKAVELGVFEMIPVATKRAVVKLDEKKADKKMARWNAIAEGAAKQSGRSMIPKVHEVMSFADALRYARTLDVRLIPYEKAEGMDTMQEALKLVVPGKSVAVFIGPEGGFEESEVGLAMTYGVIPVSLGRRILRTETAGFTVLSILMYHLECLRHKV